MNSDRYYEFEVSLLGFLNIKIINPIKIKKKKLFTLVHTLNEKIQLESEIYSCKAIDFSTWTGRYHSDLFKCLNDFDFLGTEILKTWIAGLNNINWKDFDSPNKKRSWLHACLFWQGLAEDKQVLNQEIEIFGDKIESTEDLYCMLGEGIYGYGGYAGQDLYGFDEFIKYITYTEKKRLTIKIHNYQNLVEIFDTFMPDHLYEKYFFEILEKAGCLVIK